jgi:hypothetical protein
LNENALGELGHEIYRATMPLELSYAHRQLFDDKVIFKAGKL